MFENRRYEGIRTFKKREIIFKRGDFELFMYAIESGEVGIYADYGTDKERLLITLYAGDTFGEMGLIESKPRSATAVALEKTKAAVIDIEGFGEYFKDKPAKIVQILQKMSARIRELTDAYMQAVGPGDEK